MSSFRNLYARLFVSVILASMLYVMSRSLAAGVGDFEEHFYKRDFLVGLAVRLKYEMGDRVFPQVLIENDGWMAHITEKEPDYFQNARPLKGKAKIADEIASLNEYLAGQGITLLVVAAPSKASIYPEMMPDELKPFSTLSKLDELLAYMRENNQPSLLDLRPALSRARQEQDVYYKTNTHWNGYGAYVAYAEILGALAQSHPELIPYPIDELQLITTPPEAQDLPRIMRANFIVEPSFYFEPQMPFVQTLTSENYFGYHQAFSAPNDSLPALLIFHDSFGEYYLNNYLAMNFSQSHFVYNNAIRKYLSPQELKKIQPDIVIIEILERNIEMLENHLGNFKP